MQLLNLLTLKKSNRLVRIDVFTIAHIGQKTIVASQFGIDEASHVLSELGYMAEAQA